MQASRVMAAEEARRYHTSRIMLHREQLPPQPIPREKVLRAQRTRRRLAELQIDREIRAAA